jgi:sec-independent protein translocase protein TatA
MPSIGPLELGIILLIILVIFGPKRLPEMGRSLGKGMREFKDSISGKDDDDDEPAQTRLTSELPRGEEPVGPAQHESAQHGSTQRDTVS